MSDPSLPKLSAELGHDNQHPWESLKGVSVAEATRCLHELDPTLKIVPVQLVNGKARVLDTLDPQRVRLYHDEDGIVKCAPYRQ